MCVLRSSDKLETKNNYQPTCPTYMKTTQIETTNKKIEPINRVCDQREYEYASASPKELDANDCAKQGSRTRRTQVAGSGVTHSSTARWQTTERERENTHTHVFAPEGFDTLCYRCALSRGLVAASRRRQGKQKKGNHMCVS